MELTSTTVLFSLIGSLVVLSAVFIFLPALAQTNNTTSMTGTNMTSAGNQTVDNATGQTLARQAQNTQFGAIVKEGISKGADEALTKR